MEENSRGFWKGFWIGFGIFMMCSLMLAGLLFFSGVIGFERWYASHEPVPSQNEPTKPDPDGPGEEADENEAAAARFREVMDCVDDNLVLDYDKAEMINAALKAYVEASNDRYSEYLTAEEYEDMMENTSGSYCGIGVQIQQNAETMVTTVIRVFSNSSALEEGVRDGDIIIAVNGEDVTKMPVDEIVLLVRGEEGTTVEVTFNRPWEEKDYSLVLTRRPVEVDTVFYEMVDDKIGYLKLTEFDSVSAGQMEKALQTLKDAGCKQLILDIRSNPGGLLSSVLDISDFFLKKGLLIFSMEDKDGRVYEYYSEEGRKFTGEITLLVNGNSASASEVLTGCLKDHGAAVIMGEQTFGKGIVQGFFKLSDGSVIKLTTEHYQTPDGHDIHKVGIAPDIEGADDPATEDVDELLEQAIEYFRNK